MVAWQSKACVCALASFVFFQVFHLSSVFKERVCLTAWQPNLTVHLVDGAGLRKHRLRTVLHARLSKYNTLLSPLLSACV